MEFDKDIYYIVEFDDFKRETISETALELYNPQLLSFRGCVQNNLNIPWQDFQIQFFLKKVGLNLTDKFYSSNATTANFHAYQFLPLIKMLDSETGRLLIADEVGLGKTIESGYIISELLTRNDISSILIICPKHLSTKWMNEMKRFFNLEFEPINDGNELPIKFQNRARFSKLIVGLELIRREEYVHALEQGLIDEQNFQKDFKPFDLIVVDEAHHLRHSETGSHRAVKVLLDNCKYALFVTATPINTHIDDLITLLNLLVYQNEMNLKNFNEIMEPNRLIIKILILLDRNDAKNFMKIKEILSQLAKGNEFSKLIFNQLETDGRLNQFLNDPTKRTPENLGWIRYFLDRINTLSGIINNTRKRDIADHEQIFPIRHPQQPILVQLNPIEQEFFSKAYKFLVNLIIRKSKSIPSLGLIKVMPQRIVASSIHGTFKKLENLRKKKSFEPEYNSEDEEYIEESDVQNIILTDGELKEVENLLLYKSQIGSSDSKFNKALERIKEYFSAGNHQVIIFSYFKNTIEYLSEQFNRTDFSAEEQILKHQIKANYIHGDCDQDTRNKRMKDFEMNNFQILILSEVGSEGIDLQFCNCMINYDLPWNPMKLEQRIGRLDRLGQKNPIFITNLFVEGSIEDEILNRLYERIDMITENLVFLNPILEEIYSKRTAFFFKPERTREELNEIVEKVAQNLNIQKNIINDIHSKLDDIKGDTSKTLFYQQGLIEEKRNFFTLKDLFTTINYLIRKFFPGTDFEDCSKDRHIKSFFIEKKISFSDKIFALKVSPELLKFSEKFNFPNESLNDEFNSFLYKLDATKDPSARKFQPILFTYDPEILKDKQYVNFVDLLTLNHIFVRFLFAQIELNKWVPNILYTHIVLPKIPSNAYFIFSYLLKVEGIREFSRIQTVCFDLEKRQFLESEDYAKITALLNDENILNKSTINESTTPAESVNLAFRKSMEFIFLKQKELITQIQIEAKNVYKFKTETTTQKYDSRINAIQNTIKKVKEARILRLLESQLNKNITNKSKELQQLKDKYEQSNTISIVELALILLERKI